MDHLEKCKLLVCCESELLRVKNMLDVRPDDYPDVIHDLYTVVKTLYEIQRDELENSEVAVEKRWK